MNEIIIRIWDHREYEKRDANNELFLGKMICWNDPIIPTVGDYILIDESEKRIDQTKRIFKPKKHNLTIEILIWTL